MASNLSLLLLVLCALTVAEAGLRVFNMRATNIPSDAFGPGDGYVKVSCGSVNIGTTSVILNNPNPWWNEQFSYFSAKEDDLLRLEVYDRDLVFDDLLGTCTQSIRVGTYENDCYLTEGGILHYAYTLS
ncbi:perforin-1-like [Scomber scombrus]|uniref:Perforin-1-like n=1 Tax=Scomber scombrus TaxID=13677 RepID=A0AAV1NJ03_SCOSC